MSNPYGTRWRGQIPIPAKAHPLVRELIKEANRQHTTMTEIAARAGLRRETLGAWSYRRSPSLNNIVAALNVLGKTLVVKEVGRHAAGPRVIDMRGLLSSQRD